MFTEKEKNLFSQSRAVLDLHGFFVITNNDYVLDNPKVLVNLLNIKESITYDSFSEASIQDKIEIEESIVVNNIVTIVNFPEEVINLNRTPAGVISFIAEAVLQKTQEYLIDPVSKYAEVAESINFLEEMSSIVSYYTNTPLDTVLSWSVSQIFKRYAMCQRSFPNQVNALIEPSEE